MASNEASADNSDKTSEIAVVVRRADCECALLCFPEQSVRDGSIKIVDISMGFTIEIHFQDLAAQIPDLAVFNACCNRISVLACSGSPPLSNLVWLDLSHNMLTAVPSDLAKVSPNLVHVDFSSNHFNELTSAVHLGGLVKLQHADFSYNQLHNLEGVHHLTSVIQLDLQRNQIENTMHIAGCLRLNRLNLAYNLLKSAAECISTVGKLPKLNRLEIYGNPFCIENGNTDVRTAFAVKTRLIFLDGVNIRSLNADLSISFLRSTKGPGGSLVEVRRIFEDKLRGIHSDYQADMDRLKRLMEDLTTKFNDRCERLGKDYEATKIHTVHSK